MKGPMILAISGSLRRSSVNSAALRAAASAAARAGIAVTVTDMVRELPHFDPDLEDAPPVAALRFRAACEAATGVLISVPEYAFGIPGAFKNALDWTVRSGSLYRKPVAVLDVAPPGRGGNLRRSLGLVLTALDADVVYRALPVSAGDRDSTGEIANLEVIESLGAIVAELAGRAMPAQVPLSAG